jgi:hypothetical protein
MKQEVLDQLNKIVLEENGTAVTINDMFLDSDLDSLGTMLVLVELDAYYPFLDSIPKGVDVVTHLDLTNLTVRDLILKCVVAISHDTNNRPVR